MSAVTIACKTFAEELFADVGNKTSANKHFLAAKLLNLFSKKKINPLVGAAGISAFPMASRVVQKMGVKEDPTNHLLMHAAGANVSGQIASAIVGGLILGIL